MRKTIEIELDESAEKYDTLLFTLLNVGEWASKSNYVTGVQGMFALKDGYDFIVEDRTIHQCYAVMDQPLSTFGKAIYDLEDVKKKLIEGSQSEALLKAIDYVMNKLDDIDFENDTPGPVTIRRCDGRYEDVDNGEQENDT